MATLTAHIEALNAKTQAWLDANPGAWAGMIVTDPEHWAEAGIYTAAQFDRYMDEECYSEQYKSVYGVRPRHIADMTDEQLTAAIKRMDAEVEEMIEREREEEARFAAMESLRAAEKTEAKSWDDYIMAEAARVEEMANAAPLPWEAEAMRFGG